MADINVTPALQTFSFPPLATTDWVETYIPLAQYTATHPALDPKDPMITTSTVGLMTTDDTGLYSTVPTAGVSFSTVKYYHTWIPISYTQTFAPTADSGNAIVTLGTVQSGSIGIANEGNGLQSGSHRLFGSNTLSLVYTWGMLSGIIALLR